MSSHGEVKPQGLRAIRRALLPMLALMVGLLTLAPQASATSDTDLRFLREWHGDGLYASSDQAAIDAAHVIVSYLDDHATQDGVTHVADIIVHANDGQDGHYRYSYFEAGEQTYLAVYYYGPQHMALLDEYTRPTPPPHPTAPNANPVEVV